VNFPDQRSTNEPRFSPPGIGAERSNPSTNPDTLVFLARATLLARLATAGSMVSVIRFFIMHTLSLNMHTRQDVLSARRVSQPPDRGEQIHDRINPNSDGSTLTLDPGLRGVPSRVPQQIRDCRRQRIILKSAEDELQRFAVVKDPEEIARKAFDAAYERECAAIAAKLREMTAAIEEPRDIWLIHDFLSRRRREIDHKYDYRYSVLIEVFARLIREGRINMADLAGLREDKIEKLKLWLSL
jgi:hypothetical protein